MDGPLFYFAAIACLFVLGVLLFGVLTFARGGEFNKRNANKIMRIRIVAQAVAIVLILATVWFAKG